VASDPLCRLIIGDYFSIFSMTKRSGNLADLYLIPKNQIPSTANHIFNTPTKRTYSINYMYCENIKIKV
jgi:hypothetical protein